MLNTASMPTGDLVSSRDASLRIGERTRVITEAVGHENLSAFDANRVAEELMGDSVFANVVMLGSAWQKGLVPVSKEALVCAIELNNVAVDKNTAAFEFGRLLAARPDALAELLEPERSVSETLEDVIRVRSEFLEDYQDAAYARRFCSTIETFRAGYAGPRADDLAVAAAKSLFKLMAYKDEYEVARLHADERFHRMLSDEFEPGYRIHYHFAPPILPTGIDARGRPRKIELGAWMEQVLRALARLKRYRGSSIDLFAGTNERRTERELIGWYQDLLAEAKQRLSEGNADSWVEILEAPLGIRGFGPVKEEAVLRTKQLVQRKLDQLAQTRTYSAK